jgi:hypothetical protein
MSGSTAPPRTQAEIAAFFEPARYSVRPKECRLLDGEDGRAYPCWVRDGWEAWARKGPGGECKGCGGRPRGGAAIPLVLGIARACGAGP